MGPTLRSGRRRRTIGGLRLSGILLLVLTGVAGRTQEPVESRPRPRIGLVLSGGGARGAAHVGVLQVLEELHIPIDCVAGTSMGAIIGGLYAYGLSPAELERQVTRKGLPHGWAYLLQDGPDHPGLPFRRREEARSYLAKLRLGVRDAAIRLPKGLVQGQNLETELRFLTLEAHDLRSFDELPLPFRCTAVDIGTGEQVVLDHGNLADALRASMSLPGVFAPAVVDGRELLDGGLADNVPIAVARAMGADVVIVVDIGSPLAKGETIVDVFDVSKQVVSILTQQNVDRSLATMTDRDLLIRPDLQDITAADFGRAAESIAIGHAAALAQAATLRRWSVSPAEYERFLGKQRRPPRPAPIVRSVEIENGSRLDNGLIQQRLALETQTALSPTELRAGVDRLFAIDDFQRVRFDVHDWQDDSVDVRVAAEQKDWGPSFLQFGLSLQSDFDNSTYQLAGLLVLRQLNSLGAELRNVVEVGQRRSLSSELYQPLTNSGTFFVAPRAQGTTEDVDLYVNGNKTSEQSVQYGELGVDGGVAFGNTAELRLGYGRASGDTEVGLSSLPVPNTEFDDGYLRARFAIDTFDAPYFVTSGGGAKTEYRTGLSELGSDENYQSLLIDCSHAFTFGPVTLLPRIEWDSTIAGTRPIYVEPSLGGFLRLSGLPQDSLRGQHAALGSLQARGLIVEGAIPVYGGASFEVGNVWQRRQDEWRDLVFSGSVFFALDTPLGPLYTGAGFAEAGEVTGFLFLGRR
ncbi:MAG TPA: patatin-like phospholipase family protein [Planctomycetota bacterium]|nr:patatin-like phospholipase family protein [Planctomycetota bacterium]